MLCRRVLLPRQAPCTASIHHAASVSLSGFTVLIRVCCRRGMGLHHRLHGLSCRLLASATLDLALIARGLFCGEAGSRTPLFLLTFKPINIMKRNCSSCFSLPRGNSFLPMWKGMLPPFDNQLVLSIFFSVHLSTFHKVDKLTLAGLARRVLPLVAPTPMI